MPSPGQGPRGSLIAWIYQRSLFCYRDAAIAQVPTDLAGSAQGAQLRHSSSLCEIPCQAERRSSHATCRGLQLNE